MLKTKNLVALFAMGAAFSLVACGDDDGGESADSGTMTDEGTDETTDETTDGTTDGTTNETTDGTTDEGTDEGTATVETDGGVEDGDGGMDDMDGGAEDGDGGMDMDGADGGDAG